MDRREFLAGSAATAAVIRMGKSGVTHALAATEAVKAFGSGHFGEWITDDHGLPAYRYTCDQRTDPHAKTTTHKDFLGPTDHLHEAFPR